MNKTQAFQLMVRDLPKAITTIGEFGAWNRRMQAAETIKDHARRVKDPQLAVLAVQFYWMSKRAIGQFLLKTAEDGTRSLGRPRKGSKIGAPSSSDQFNLKDLDIDKNISRDCQKLGRMEDDEYEKLVAQQSRYITAQITHDKKDLRLIRDERKRRRVGARAAREELQGKKIRALSDRRFGVILANLPWGRTQWSSGEEDKRITKVEDLDIQWLNWAKDIDAVAAPDCTLGLWCTEPWRGVAVMQAWGFEPRGSFTWVEDIVPDKGEHLSKAKTFRTGDTFTCTGGFGKGYWNRHRVQFLLIGARGRPVAPSEIHRTEQVWFAKRPGKTGEKPETAPEWFNLQFPHVPKLELYAFNYRKDWAQCGPDLPDGPRGINDAANEPMRFGDAEDASWDDAAE